MIAPIAIAASSVLIDTGLNYAEEYLKEYEKGLSQTTCASGEYSTSHDCFAFIYGKFGPKSSSKSESWEQTGLVDEPALHIEFAATKTDDNKPPASYAPVYVSYAQSLAKNQRGNRKSLTVAVTFSENAIAEEAATRNENTQEKSKAKASEPAIMRFNLGQLETGKVHTNSLKNIKSGIKLPAGNTVNTISVLVTESEDPSIALKALTSAFSSNKDGLKTAISGLTEEAIGED